MADRQFKMLRKEGRGIPYPFTEALNERGDMKTVYMTKAEIDEMVKNGGVESMYDAEPVAEEEPKLEPEPDPKPTKPRYQVNQTRVNATQAKAAKEAAEKAKADELAVKVAEAEKSILED